MTKEEFKLQKSVIREQISLLNDELKRVEKQYIDSNKEFDIGDMVEIKRSNGKNEVAFISNIYVSFSDKVEYKFKKPKKDGTMSSINIYEYYGDKIEKIKLK